MPALVTNPGAVLQNLIQPVADAVALDLRPFSDAQTNLLLRVQNAAGSIDNLVVTAKGHLGVGVQTGNGENWFGDPGTGNPSLEIYGPTGNPSSNPILQVFSGSQPFFYLNPTGQSTTVAITANSDSDTALFVACNSLTSTADIASFADGRFVHRVGIQPSGVLYLGDRTVSPNTAHHQAEFAASFVNNTDATFTSRLIVSEVDHAGSREALRIEADGAAARIGFLGANAAVQQTGGAATATLVYTATERDMLNTLWTAMRTYGLLS